MQMQNPKSGELISKLKIKNIFSSSKLQFLGWLSEAESACENAEQDIERNPLAHKVC